MTRRDFLNDPSAPEANSIAVAVSVFIQDENGLILMIRRTDNDLYSIPGGQLELGETLTQAATREVREETGMDIEISGMVGVFSNPNHVIKYDDGEVRQEFSICFRGRPLGGRIRPSTESSEVIWVMKDDLGSLNIHPSTLIRLNRALEDAIEPYYT